MQLQKRLSREGQLSGVNTREGNKMSKERRDLTREEAEARLIRNGVEIEGLEIKIPLAGMGLKCWAASDCLTKYHKYRVRNAS